MAPRHLQHPGVRTGAPFESHMAAGIRLEFEIAPGSSLIDGLAFHLEERGIAAAAIQLEGGAFEPLRYLMPALSSDGVHAAWYSELHAPHGEAALEKGCVTYGTRDGAPFCHCHAVWQEGEERRAGHIVPDATIISRPVRVTAYATADISLLSEPDEETGFTLFHPLLLRRSQKAAARFIFARVKPNEDIIETLEAVCRIHGIASATIRGSVGSLIGARYEGGARVADVATEVFIDEGVVTADGSGSHVAITMVDTRGGITSGRLMRGDNPVCITFELCLEVDQASRK